MENFWRVIGWVDSGETLVLLFMIAAAIALWGRGIWPALYRLGNGLANRRIAVFAKSDNLTSLQDLLVQSRLFKPKNIFGISIDGDLSKAEKSSVYLVYWPDWKDKIEKILDMKPHDCPLVVYAPFAQGRIPDNTMARLDGKRHTAITNFRGRLLNDIVTSMITTSYEQD